MSKKKKPVEASFAKNLTEMMAAKGLTNKAAAELAETSPTTIQDWKTGVSPTDYLAVRRLADFMCVSMSFLLTGIHEPHHDNRTPSIHEVFVSGGPLFDGYAKVTIEKLLPRDPIAKPKRS